MRPLVDRISQHALWRGVSALGVVGGRCVCSGGDVSALGVPAPGGGIPACTEADPL